MTDYDLQRFVDAQDAYGTYADALAELRAGRKRSHWMWFVFPQLRGLGRSDAAWHYGLDGLDEARAYLDHPVLGRRLRECAHALLALGSTDAEAVLGPVDAMKLRSCMTLLHLAANDAADDAADGAADGGERLFADVLDRFFDGVPDPATTELLSLAGGEDRRPREGGGQR